MNILSIQSRVTYGHVGNAAATFPLQRLGHEVWPVDTVSLSNHLGYKTWRGRMHAPEELAAIIDGLGELGVLDRCDAVLSGFLGDAANGPVVLDAVTRVRAANPRALYCCDPVMGDRGVGLYVRPGVAEAFAAHLLPAADILLPNAFELEQLTDGGTDTLAAALDAADRLRAASARRPLVVVTSLRRCDAPADRIEVLTVGDDGAWIASTPFLTLPAHGTGDCFAALFLGHYLRERDPAAALAQAVAGVFAVVQMTVAAGTYELQLVAAQDAFAAAEPTAITRLR